MFHRVTTSSARRPGRPSLRSGVAVFTAAAAAFSLAACNRESSSDAGGTGGEAAVGVALITKDSTNPFFVAMQKGAKADAAKNNVKLTVASGKQEGDDQGQITAIEDSIARGDNLTVASHLYSRSRKFSAHSAQQATRSNPSGRSNRVSNVSRSRIRETRYVRDCPSTAATRYQTPPLITTPSGSTVRST